MIDLFKLTIILYLFTITIQGHFYSPNDCYKYAVLNKQIIINSKTDYGNYYPPDNFYKCLEKTGKLDDLVISMVRFEMSTWHYIFLTKNNEYVFFVDEPKRTKMNKVIKFCSILFPDKRGTRGDSQKYTCSDPEGVNTCVYEKVKKINRSDANSLLRAFNDSYKINQNSRANTYELVKDDRAWKTKMLTLLENEKYEDSIDCLKEYNCGGYFGLSYDV